MPTNPDIKTFTTDKPKIIILSKVDLADTKITDEWIGFYKSKNINCIALDIIKNKKVKNIDVMIGKILKYKIDKYKSKGVSNYTLRGMILGIPNVGKSSLINKICNNNIAKVGNRPGVTKSKQWIKTKWGIELLDTPGILWPKITSKQVGLNLSYIGSIKDEILDIEEIAFKLIEFLSLNHKSNLEIAYGVSLSENIFENLDTIGKKLGCIKRGSLIDYDRLSKIILMNFRDARLGNISLETTRDLEEGEN